MQRARLVDFAALCERLGATSSRLERAGLISAFLEPLAPEDAQVASRLLVGRAFAESEGRRLSLRGRAVWDALRQLGATADVSSLAGVADFGDLVRRVIASVAARAPSLSLADLAAGFAAIAASSGRGSRRARVALLRDLLARATPLEAKYIAKIVIGEMRHGVQEGIVLDALAKVAGCDDVEIRRAHQTLGDVGHLAALVKTEGVRHLGSVGVHLFRPLKPMLAQTAGDVGEAFAAMQGSLALEWKLDGARVQIHKQGKQVRLFSRRLKDITPSLPEIVALVARQGRADTAILEGEVVATAGGRMLPFQELMRRFRRIRDVDQASGAVPVRLYLFDLLLRDGKPLLDAPAEQRWAELQEVCGCMECVPRTVPADAAEGQSFFDAAVAAGAEGVMAKALHAPYTPGVRGKGWLKIKKIISLDLVIVAADWGYGRRHGWLSNYHLAARDVRSGAFVPVGKTFKGLTDAEFRGMTARLLDLKIGEAKGTVFVRPEVVVEVRFGDIQRSPQYECGMALRFARIARIRNDKEPTDADTLDTIRALYEKQSGGAAPRAPRPPERHPPGDDL